MERLRKCPPAFKDYCVLLDGTRCPYYHEGKCVKAEEAPP